MGAKGEQECYNKGRVPIPICSIRKNTQEVEKMSKFEELATVPTKMKEKLVHMKRNCACYSSFTSFILILVLGMFIGHFLSSLK